MAHTAYGGFLRLFRFAILLFALCFSHSLFSPGRIFAYLFGKWNGKSVRRVGQFLKSRYGTPMNKKTTCTVRILLHFVRDCVILFPNAQHDRTLRINIEYF